MSHQTELDKYFTKSQQEDLCKLNMFSLDGPPLRIQSRRRKYEDGHIPRPLNSFFQYRQDKQAIIKKFCPRASHRLISKVVAQWWHSASHEEKVLYEEKALLNNIEHKKKYPDYVFRPKPKKAKRSSNDTTLPNQTHHSEYSETEDQTKCSPPVEPNVENFNSNNDINGYHTRTSTLLENTTEGLAERLTQILKSYIRLEVDNQIANERRRTQQLTTSLTRYPYIAYSSKREPYRRYPVFISNTQPPNLSRAERHFPSSMGTDDTYTLPLFRR